MTSVRSLTVVPRVFPGMGQLSASVVYLMGCRSFSQFCCTLRSLRDPTQFCPFCEAELERRGRLPDAENAYWRLLKNEFPHKATRQMWLIVPRQHISHPDQLTPKHWTTIGEILSATGVDNGGVMWRFGHPRYNVGSIEHFHINVIEPICGREYRPPFAKDLPEHVEDFTRALGFQAELETKGGEKWLFSAEGIEETQPKAV